MRPGRRLVIDATVTVPAPQPCATLSRLSRHTAGATPGARVPGYRENPPP